MPKKMATFKRTLPQVTENLASKDDLNEMNATVSATSFKQLEEVPENQNVKPRYVKTQLAQH